MFLFLIWMQQKLTNAVIIRVKMAVSATTFTMDSNANVAGDTKEAHANKVRLSAMKWQAVILPTEILWLNK